ncbi:MAG: ADP-ribosylglycohydrolase family protein [Streptosporangiaceae bacterium]
MPAWNCLPTPWAKCTAATSSEPAPQRALHERPIITETLTRARGALYGLAIGDALGMPTQMLSRAEIVRRWGPLLPGFEAAPPGHPIAANMPAGSVTDDTEQAVLLARLLVKGHGTIGPHELAAALADWERDMAERGSLDLLGPSTKRAVAAILAGVPPEEAGAAGTTNGAAMRIAPVGIAVPLDPVTLDPVTLVPVLPSQAGLSTLVDHVVMASSVTHNTGIALAGAAAVAAAVSAGVSGATIAGATALGIEAARIAAGRGHWVAGADVAARIEWAAGLVAGRAEDEAAELIYTLAGTSLATQESVPAAFAVLAVVPEDPWSACRLAASLGGDCDTIAAMAGAIAGACHGAGSCPPEAIAVIDAQGLGLADQAGELLALRGRPGSRAR